MRIGGNLWKVGCGMLIYMRTEGVWLDLSLLQLSSAEKVQ